MFDGCCKILLSLLLVSISLSVVTDGAADTKEYVKKVNDLNFPAMYSDYPELKTIQSQMVSSLQGRPVIDSETQIYVDLIVKIINSFNEMHSLSKSDRQENHENAIVKAESIKSDIESLEIYREPREKYYPILAKISLRRFYKNQAEYFANKAKNERNTNDRIKSSLNEARAYKNLGDPKYAEINYRAEELKAEYEHDIKVIKDSIQESIGFINKADSFNDNGFFSSIELFGKGFQLEDGINNAIQLSSKHEEVELKNQGEELIEKIRVIKKEKGASVIKYLVFISVIYLIVSLYFSWSIARWKKEAYNADLGNDLLEGLILE